MPEISFLMAVFNGEEFLNETIDSLLAQDHNDFDIVLIDDGSVDRTAEIAHEYKDDRIKYYYQENGGLVNALNAGLEKIDAPFVARIDADDTCFPHRLKSQREFMDFTQADAVSSAAVDVTPEGHAKAINRHNASLFTSDPRFFPAKEPYLPHPFMMVRRWVFDKIGNYRQAHLAEDSDLCWRMQEECRIALQSDALGNYRVHESSISSLNPNSGRVQAVWSQIAALNAVRRRAGWEEVPYKCSIAEAKDMAASIRILVDYHSEDLSEEEYTNLLAASSAKWIDLFGWRGHQMEEEEFKQVVGDMLKVKVRGENAEKFRWLINRAQAKVERSR